MTQVCGSMEGQNVLEKVLLAQEEKKEKEEKKKEGGHEKEQMAVGLIIFPSCNKNSDR